MLRLLIGALVLLAAAYFYLNQGGEDARPLETQQQALEKAREVEKVVEQHNQEMKARIEAQTSAAGDDGDD